MKKTESCFLPPTKTLNLGKQHILGHAYGTMEGCPALSNFFSLVLFLLQNRKQDQYTRAFKQLKEIKPGHIVVYFEKVSISVFQKSSMESL